MSSVRHQLVSGVFWTSLAKYSGMAVSLAVTSVLSRIYSPDDFGDVAVVTVLIAFFAIFSDIGIGPAIIQRKELDRKDLSDIFSFTVWLGLGVSLLFFASADAVARYYGSPVLGGLCRVLTANLFFQALNIVPNALLYRDKRFRFIAFRTLVVQALAGAAAVAAALGGMGIYALTVNPILSSAILLAINYRQNPLPLRLRPSRSALSKVFNFSAYQFAFNLINYFTRNLDKLLMGRYMDRAALGYYDKSYRLMMLPLQQITYVVSPVLHPVFSDFRSDLRQLSGNYLKVVRLLSLVGLPLSAVLVFCGRELILLLFGPQWGPSVTAFRILSLSVGMQIVLSTSGAIFQAADSTRMMFRSGLLSAGVTAAAVATGIFWRGTVEAVAWCILASFAVNYVQCFWILFRQTLGWGWGGFWRAHLLPLLCTLCVALPLWALERFLPGLPLFGSLVLKGALAAAVWLVFVQLSGAFDLLQIIRSRLRR